MNKSKAENTDLNTLADNVYKEFIRNESCCGLNSIFKDKNIGSKTALKIRKIIYTKYGEKPIKSISGHRTAKNAHKNRTKESYNIPLNRRKKMIEGMKKYWEGNDIAKQKSRELMIKHCLPNSQSPNTKLKRRESRKGYRHSKDTKLKIKNSLKGKPLSVEHRLKLRKKKSKTRQNFKHTVDTKQLLSKLTKKQWEDGIHKPVFKSKGHAEILDIILKLGYNVEEEYLIKGRPYDVYVPQKNLLIEFNGTYWHRDPRFYDKENSQLIWNKDKSKTDIALKNGYRIETVWQYDWETVEDKIQLINKILNG
jgi:hypothetical protein